MADDEIQEEKVVIDYDRIDPATGFKAAELQIWKAFEKFLAKPEDERGDVDTFVDEFAEESKMDRRRIKYVTTLGIYAGTRDDFNSRSGSGKAYYANGDVYDGEFYDGKKDGQGRYTFNSAPKSEVNQLLTKALKVRPANETDDAFVKRVAAELRVGTVIVETALQKGVTPCYHGEYRRGRRSGIGIMRNVDGSVYKGEWRDNKRHGQGMLFYINGDIYSGLWKDGQKSGFGTYRFASGDEYRGAWEGGVFLEGQWITTDGTYCEAKFDKKNRPSDPQASFHFPGNKISITGEFKKGKWEPTGDFTVTADDKVEPSSW